VSERPALTDEQHAARIKRIKAERIAAGRKPYIESPIVYRLRPTISFSSLTSSQLRLRRHSY
jgi:hypothetical protein